MIAPSRSASSMTPFGLTVAQMSDDGVGGEIEADGKTRDPDCRHDGDKRGLLQGIAALLDHQPPIRLRRLYAKTKEAQRGERDDSPGDAQRKIGGDRPEDVRQNFEDDDRKRRFPTRLSGLHIVDARL